MTYRGAWRAARVTVPARPVDRRRGFTLWELTMVLLVMSIAATLAVPAFARLGSERPATAADAMLGLLHDARKASIDYNTTTRLRLDPKTLKYQVDTIGVGGVGMLASGVLDLGMSETLETDLPRLQYLFQPTGAAFADEVTVHGGPRELTVRVDPWTGVARADSL
jgi:prepilin-type N-terminal cleavage/methylation domain-containing protein